MWARSSSWVSGCGRRDPEVHTGLEDVQMGNQAVHAGSHDAHMGPQRLQVALQNVYPGSQNIHKCPYCPYTSRLSSNLRRHVRTHTGEMPYSCPLCDFRCKDASSMKRHRGTHTRRSLPPPLSPANSRAQI
ncbi:B-cell lymphoma/leukemia 11A-like [Homarus americanus]|uniref:B-cell lymphoma/leukemia 11A-like n=1 Tax=Homarus americanus TaxID=6706 RepID=A0A8J5J9K0_HOMAM|nr:B-cell lymphoma/leukemia 11A-like [Homarus americanus]